MTPRELRRIVGRLPASQPVTDAYEESIAATTQSSRNAKVWYTTQKQHLRGWLSEYNGPGAYGRRGHDGDARAFYQRFQCVAGLLWLAEALGEDEATLAAAVDDVVAAGPRAASQCGAFRRRVPWERIESLIAARFPRG